MLGLRFQGLQAGVPLANPHQRILLLLSNAGFCRCFTARHLAQRYHPLWAEMR